MEATPCLGGAGERFIQRIIRQYPLCTAPPGYLVKFRLVIHSSFERYNMESRTCLYLCTELPHEKRREDVVPKDGAAW